MKKLTLAVAVILSFAFTNTSNAQEKSSLDKDITEKEVPAAVMATWKKTHPNQKVEKWEMKAGNYEADFWEGKKFCEFSTKPDGTWIESETKIEKADVPKEVMEAFAKSEYKDWTFDHAEQIKTPEHDKLYEVTVKKGKDFTGLYYTPDGTKLVRVEKE